MRINERRFERALLGILAMYSDSGAVVPSIHDDVRM